jgi:hypothetical protein
MTPPPAWRRVSAMVQTGVDVDVHEVRAIELGQDVTCEDCRFRYERGGWWWCEAPRRARRLPPRGMCCTLWKAPDGWDGGDG